MKKILAIVTLPLLMTACSTLKPAGDHANVSAVKESNTSSTSVSTPENSGKNSATSPSDPLPNLALSPEILFKTLSAEIAFQRGQWQVAYATMLSTAQQTRDPRLAKRAAEIALTARHPNEALAAVRLWTALSPHSDEALQNYLGLILLNDNIAEIQPLLAQKLAAAAPQARGSMLLQIQRLLSNAKNKQSAFDILKTACAPYLDLMEAHVALAQGALVNQDDALALTEANAALKIKPDSELAILTLAQATPNPDKATQLVRDFLKQHPNANEVRLAYARSLIEQKQYDQARNQFETLLKSNPNTSDPSILFALGILNAQTKHPQEAEANLKRYVEVLAANPKNQRDPNQALLLLSQLAEERNDTAAALSWLEQIKPETEMYTSAQVRRAQLLAKRGDIGAARTLLEKAQQDTNNERAQLQLIQGEAQILRDTGQTQDAATVLKNALQRFPDSPELLYDYAMICDKLSDYPKMEKALRKIITLSPDSPHAYNALGYSLADRNLHLSEALSLITKALTLAPDDPYITDSLGWVEYRLGHLDNAEIQLRKAYSLRQDPEIGIHLGEVLWKQGKQQEARKLWQDAGNNDPDNALLKSTLQRLGVK